MKEWSKPELSILGVECTKANYTGTDPDGVFIDISEITHIPGSQAVLVES